MPLVQGCEFDKNQTVSTSRHINCVEGNTTLYALPKAEIVSRWYEQTHDNFRFCFKFPATITHQAALRHCDDLSRRVFDRLAPLETRIGQYWLQLPATFGPGDLPALWQFLDTLPPISPMASKCGIRSFRQRRCRKGAQSRAAST
jgi:uncharacterized protein YecE (DUF72 family)